MKKPSVVIKTVIKNTVFLGATKYTLEKLLTDICSIEDYKTIVECLEDCGLFTDEEISKISYEIKLFLR